MTSLIIFAARLRWTADDDCRDGIDRSGRGLRFSPTRRRPRRHHHNFRYRSPRKSSKAAFSSTHRQQGYAHQVRLLVALPIACLLHMLGLVHTSDACVKHGNITSLKPVLAVLLSMLTTYTDMVWYSFPNTLPYARYWINKLNNEEGSTAIQNDEVWFDQPAALLLYASCETSVPNGRYCCRWSLTWFDCRWKRDMSTKPLRLWRRSYIDHMPSFINGGRIDSSMRC